MDAQVARRIVNDALIGGFSLVRQSCSWQGQALAIWIPTDLDALRI
jgi:hypothetical protein